MTFGLGNAELEARALALEEVLDVLDDVERGIRTLAELRAELERRHTLYLAALQ